MFRFPSLLLTLLLTASFLPLASAQSKQTEPPKAKTSVASLTGCIDEVDGHYQLISADTRSTIANLEADGFPVESFAKYLGHTVTVRGTSSPGGANPVFKVRNVESLSDVCAPKK